MLDLLRGMHSQKTFNMGMFGFPNIEEMELIKKFPKQVLTCEQKKSRRPGLRLFSLKTWL